MNDPFDVFTALDMFNFSQNFRLCPAMHCLADPVALEIRKDRKKLAVAFSATEKMLVHGEAIRLDHGKIVTARSKENLPVEPRLT